MNRTFKIETILYSKNITPKHHLHAIEASNRDGKQYLLLYLTHCKNLVAYIDDLAAVPVARVFEKDFFLLVENEDCYAYLVGDGNGEFALSIFTEKKTWSEKIVIPDLSSTLSRGHEKQQAGRPIR